MKPKHQQQGPGNIKIIVLIFFLFLLSRPFISHAEPAAGRSLDRELDPVIVIGEKLYHLLGASIEHLALLKYEDNNFEPIPFQVDEKDSEGRFIMTQGEEAGRDDDEGCLDENDELVFMAQDLGGRAILDDWQQQYTGSMEIEVIDPLSNWKGWVYLVTASCIAERSPVHYVKFEFHNNLACVIKKFDISCTDYSLNDPNHKSFRREDGEFGPKAQARMKLRLKFELLEYLSGVSFSLNEKNFNSRLVGYRDAPVRAIARIKHKVKVFGIPVGVRNTERIYYPHYSIDPYTVELPFNCRRYFKKTVVKGYRDSNNRNLDGHAFFSDKNILPVKMDGVMSPTEQKLDRSTPRWMGIAAPGKTFIQVFNFDRGLLKQARVNLYYQDDWEAAAAPEEEREQPPGLGVGIDITNLKKGTYHFSIYHFSMRKEYRQGDEQACLNILDYPLKVTAKQVGSNNS